MKITVLGDIMCEPSVLKGARRSDGSYNFDGLFVKLAPLLAESDYTVANLESPLAGEAAGYTDDYYVFNAPDALADAMKKAGIAAVSTANNHVFDRGMAGLIRTLEVLDSRGIGHTGTFAPGTPRQEAFRFTVGDTRIALVAYTYGTNKKNRILLQGDEKDCVNLLRPQTERNYLPGVVRDPDWVDRLTARVLDQEQRGRVKHFFGIPANYARADDNLNEETLRHGLQKMLDDLSAAREQADVVLCCPHIGGQFNPQPGAFSEYVVRCAKDGGADAVLASHSHVVQRMALCGGTPCAYSLGNVSMSPGSSLMLDVEQYLPQFGIAVHLYIEEKRIVKTTFSVLKAVERKKRPLTSYPADVLYGELKTDKQRQLFKAQVAQIFTTVTGREAPEGPVRREYAL